jgi:hypothetical protein
MVGPAKQGEQGVDDGAAGSIRRRLRAGVEAALLGGPVEVSGTAAQTGGPTRRRRLFFKFLYQNDVVRRH